jgi:hypothetical protein
MDRNGRAAHRRSALNTLFARMTAAVCAVTAFVTGVACTQAANPARTAHRPAYADSSRAGVLEFLDVSMDGPRARVVIDRYIQDFSYCSGVVHRIDARDGFVHGQVIVMRAGGTVHVDGSRASVDEPGSRGVHQFREIESPREHTRLVRAFLEREKRLRASIHYPAQLAEASTHCKH